jgi:hypothetical protein
VHGLPRDANGSWIAIPPARSSIIASYAWPLDTERWQNRHEDVQHSPSWRYQIPRKQRENDALGQRFLPRRHHILRQLIQRRRLTCDHMPPYSRAQNGISQHAMAGPQSANPSSWLGSREGRFHESGLWHYTIPRTQPFKPRQLIGTSC